MADWMAYLALDKDQYLYSTLVENILAPKGSVQKDSDRRGYRSYNQSDLVAGSQCAGPNNQNMDPDYMSAQRKQHANLVVEYRYSRVVEGDS